MLTIGLSRCVVMFGLSSSDTLSPFDGRSSVAKGSALESGLVTPANMDGAGASVVAVVVAIVVAVVVAVVSIAVDVVVAIAVGVSSATVGAAGAVADMICRSREGRAVKGRLDVVDGLLSRGGVGK